MKNIFLTILFIGSVHSFAFSQDLKQKKHYRTLYFYSFGLRTYWEDNNQCMSKCQKEFGFGYKVKDASTSPLKLVRIQAHNKRMEKKMVERFGADWKAQYEKALKKCNK